MTQHDSFDYYDSPAATAKVNRRGACVTDWTPTGHDPVLWVPPHADVAMSEVLGGIPVCFPWFGNGSNGALLPLHGTARLATWEKTQVRQTESGSEVSYELSVGDSAESGSSARRYHLCYTMMFGASLDLSLTVTNTGDRSFTCEEALHTYLAISDAKQIQIEGLDGAEYFCNVTKQEHAVQRGNIRPDCEIDRVYEAPGEIRVVDPGAERTLLITRTASANSIIWNPGPTTITREFGDVCGMICIEGGNVKKNALTLAPGASHTMGYRVEVFPIP